MRFSVQNWLHAFRLDHCLSLHALEVILAVPPHVRTDLMSDPAFRLGDYEPMAAHEVMVAAPAAGRPSRFVLLKRTLREKPPSFIRYVIAHELAHAFLRNAGRTPAEDPELAADALAADWGFPRPSLSR